MRTAAWMGAHQRVPRKARRAVRAHPLTHGPHPVQCVPPRREGAGEYGAEAQGRYRRRHGDGGPAFRVAPCGPPLVPGRDRWRPASARREGPTRRRWRPLGHGHPGARRSRRAGREGARVEEVARAGVDLIFCAVDMPKEETRALEERYAKAETPVVSTNSAHRMTPDVPMLLPEINPDHLEVILERSGGGSA